VADPPCTPGRMAPASAMASTRAATTLSFIGTSRPSYDGSSLPFIVEELISRGAIHLALDSRSFYFRAADALAHPFKKRVWKIDEHDKCGERIHVIMAPILREAQLNYSGNYTWGSTMHSKFGKAVVELCDEHLRPFLLGIEYQLQIDINLRRIRSRLRVLNQYLSSADSRAHLAMLNMVFGAYQRCSVNELVLKPASAQQRAEAFQRFIEDATYRQLSTESRSFGFSRLVRRAIKEFDRLSDYLITSSPLRQFVSMGAAAIAAVTKIPAPSEKLLASLATEAYLPPIVSLKQATMRATKAWRAARPPFIPCDVDREGRVWVADDDSPFKSELGGSDE
jgi:hypothetical protein